MEKKKGIQKKGKKVKKEEVKKKKSKKRRGGYENAGKERCYSTSIKQLRQNFAPKSGSENFTYN